MTPLLLGAGGRSVPDLSVAVVSYNTCGLLRACLASLIARQAAGEASLEIVVADNGSSDGSREMVHAEFPLVTWLELGENVGFGRANNAALLDATGRYFCLLNSDAEALPGALAQTLAYLDAHPDVGLAGGQLLWPDGRLQTSWGSDPTLAGVWEEQTFLREVRGRLGKDGPSKDNPPTPNSGGVIRTGGDRTGAAFPNPNPTPPELGAGGPKDVEQICGAYMVVRRKAWQQVGGFDPAYFMYNEDVDLNVRLRRAGWRVVFLPDVHITHHLGASSRADWQTRARMVSAYNQSRFYYFTRFQGAQAGRRLRLYCLLGAAIRLVGWSALALVKPSARDKVKLFREVWRQTWAMEQARERLG
jgi:N-acetylglucosaminyl-diphospho-decaprenol L-rhamnosyltransferase